MKEIITSDDILGKEAVDPDGDILGVVVKLHIDKLKRQITGITVDQGFMKPDLFIGLDYVKYFGIDAVLLSKTPEEKFKGLDVLTIHGEHLGKVNSYRMDKNILKSLIIKSTNKNYFDSKSVHIPASEIKEIGNSVILKKGFKAEEI